ncbi:ATP-binding cassette domain-containing protein [soil metagenome]
MKLAIQNVTKEYSSEGGAVHALSHVSLSVRQGEVVMLVGPSGCGKTTLMNIVAGLVKPDAGEVLVDGKPIKGPGLDRTVVFQDGALFPWLTVRQNVEFGLKQAKIPPKERTERARVFLDKVGLHKFEDRSIHELSGGMRQRVSIARAMVTDPKMILMDEPFSALDAITREDLYVEMQALWEESGTTVIFVTHNVREAVVLGHRVVLMSARPGRIQEIYDIDILRPRHIDDVDVALRAQQISHAMKAGLSLELPKLEYEHA